MTTRVITGTFLFNNDYERYYFKVFERTTSLWTHINQPMELRQYFNTVFEPIEHSIKVSAHPLNIATWLALYGRWAFKHETRDELNDITLFFADRNEAVAQEVTQLQGQLVAAETAIKGEREELLALLRGFLAAPPVSDNVLDMFDPMATPASTESIRALTELTEGESSLWIIV